MKMKTQNKTLPYVTMAAKFTLILSGNIPDNKSGISLSIGSFRLQIPIGRQSVTVVFDFEATGYRCVSLNGDIATIDFRSGKGFVFDDPHLSMCFEQSLIDESDGMLNIYDLTAKLLSDTTEIEYFGVEPLHDNIDWDIDEVKIERLSFSDGDNIYNVSQRTIDIFNEWKDIIKYHI